jgi:FkbM family methyltransferase
VKKILGAAGLELRRLDLVDFDRRRTALLGQRGVDLVLDVGANEGQYVSRLRSTGYTGNVVSFEPLRSGYRDLSSNHGRDPHWQGRPYGLGDSNGTAYINTASDSVSSSVLEPSEALLEAAPRADVIERVEAEFRTLDSIWDEVAGRASTPFLKLDVQGFEHRVLDGAEESLNHIGAIEVEMALFPLYESGSQIYDLLPRLHDLGFIAIGTRDGFVDPRTYYTLDIDVLLVRA